MKLTAIILLTSFATATTNIAYARGFGGFGGQRGASSYSPGQQFRTNGPTGGRPGASGYAPGHMFKRHSYRGASSFAPGSHMRRP